MSDLTNGWRLLDSARTRLPFTPWIVLCESIPGLPPRFVVSRVTSQGGLEDAAYFTEYRFALGYFHAWSERKNEHVN